MREWLICLLKHLDALVPHDEGTHLALTYAQYGNDSDGWEDRLALSVRLNNETKVLFVEAGDLDKDLDTLTAEVSTALANVKT